MPRLRLAIVEAITINAFLCIQRISRSLAAHQRFAISHYPFAGVLAGQLSQAVAALTVMLAGWDRIEPLKRSSR